MAGEEGNIFGIEDELLHIFLFNKVLEKASKAGKSTDNMGVDGELDKYIKEVDPATKEYLGHKAAVGDSPTQLSLSISIRHMIHHPDNPHTIDKTNDYNDEELQQSMKILNKILSV